MKIFKRIVNLTMGVLFSFAVISSQTVTQVKAETSVNNVVELENAVRNAVSGETVVLSSNFVYGNAKLIASNKDITVDGNNQVFSSGTITIEGSGSGTITVKNMKFEANNSRAFYVNSSARTVIDNITVDGRTTEGVDGTAVGIGWNSNLTIRNSTFSNNVNSSAGYSGAVGSKGFAGSLTIENSVFVGNKNTALGTVVGGEGGALWFYMPSDKAKFKIKNNYFEANEAVKDPSGSNAKLADGGAIAFFNIVQGVNINIESNTFYKNIAGDDAGAVLIQSNSNVESDVRFTNNVFYQNEAQGKGDGSSSGGAVQLYSNGTRQMSNSFTAHFVNNSFVENTSNNRAGGAVANAGYWLNKSNGVYINNIFVGNTSQSASNNGIAGTGNIDNGGNIGYDSGSANVVETSKVYGELSFELSTIDSIIKIRYSNDDIHKFLPTLYIMPNGLADNTAGKPEQFEDQFLNERSMTKSDVGAIEIGYVLLDANGGIYGNETRDTIYKGGQYQISNDNGEIVKVYKISHLGGEIEMPTSPAKMGETFVGYSLTVDGNILSDNEINDVISSIKEETVLYANYRKEAKTYTVTYDGNGQTGGIVPSDANEYEAGSRVNILSGTPIKSGYVFKGWSNGEKTYQAGESMTMPEASVILEAVWEKEIEPAKTYTVTYDGNGQTGGIVPSDANEYEAGSRVNILSGTPIKSGYVFKGWSDGEKIYQAGENMTMPEASVILEAVWEKEIEPAKTYTVTYDGNGQTGGIVPSDANEYEAGSRVNILSGTPIKSGYVFKGWSDGEKIYQAGESMTMPEASVILEAVWEKDSNKRPPLPNTGVDNSLKFSYILVAAGALIITSLALSKNKKKK